MATMNSALRILHVEDNRADAELTQELLETGGFACDITRVETEPCLREALRESEFDLVLADYTLPGFDGQSALRIVLEQRPDLPVIFLSGTMGEEVAIDALKLGATDYVLKTRMSRLVPAVHRALREARERNDLRRAAQEIRQREAKIRRLVDSNIVGILISTADSRIIEANDAFLQIIGYTRDDLMAGTLHWPDLTPPEWHPAGERAVSQLNAEGVCGLFEKQYIRADGTLVPVLIAAAAIEGTEGENVAFVLDLTERKRAEEAARRSERELRDVIQTIPAIVWTAHPDGSCEFANQRWVEYTGMSAVFPPDCGWHSAIHPDDLSRYFANWYASVSAAEPFEEEVRFRGADGQYRWFMVRGVPLRDEHGIILRWYGVMTDIEDRRRVEQLQADLAHVSRVNTMGELVSSISHEVLQPILASTLSAESALSSLGRDEPNLEDVRKAAANCLEAARRASAIIYHLRSLYKKTPPRREVVAVNDAIGDVLDLLRGEADQYGVSIRTDLAPDVAAVFADRVQVQQVLMNLMLNGIEAMRETAGMLTVKCQGYSEENLVVISVRDTGVGLPPEKGERIFDAFFTTKEQGSGMGLAICRTIIESHGGHIWATSNDERGTTFHFTLPAATRADAGRNAA